MSINKKQKEIIYMELKIIDLIRLLDGFTYYRVIDNFSFLDISDIELANNADKYIVKSISHCKDYIEIYVDKM